MMWGLMSQEKQDSSAAPLHSVHTRSFPWILESLNATIVVTTYQAGKLVLLRAEPGANGPVLNTHFRGFSKPMGFAWEPGRFALGTTSEVWEFHDMPAVAPKVDTDASPRKHDTVFLPRTCHVTGNVQVHEMGWVRPQDRTGDASLSELWFVNTRFSCLATHDSVYSFVPRWIPPFISELSADDRCHLNGLGLRDGRPRYVTALGQTNSAGGWRDKKRSGGILMDMDSGEVILGGLSMPHSPRWHDNRLWVLESGNGAIGVVDQQAGRLSEICRLPGFTRGFDFVGPYAFVGLSQVRESAVFSGVKIAEMPPDQRSCGVWAIDLRSGEVAGFCKFTSGVQEIFAVQVLPNIAWPDVMNENPEIIADSYELGDDALRLISPGLRSSASDPR